MDCLKTTVNIVNNHDIVSMAHEVVMCEEANSLMSREVNDIINCFIDRVRIHCIFLDDFI